MDMVTLPLLDPEDRIGEAIQQMNAMDRRAIVVKARGGPYRLYRNTDVLEGWRVKKEKLGDLSGGEAIHLMDTFPDIEDLIKDYGKDPERHEAASKALDNANAPFGVIPSMSNTGQWIRLVTRHEGFAEQIKSSVKACVCSVDQQHNSDAPPATEGPTCPVCGNNSWRCA